MSSTLREQVLETLRAAPGGLPTPDLEALLEDGKPNFRARLWSILSNLRTRGLAESKKAKPVLANGNRGQTIAVCHWRLTEKGRR